MKIDYTIHSSWARCGANSNQRTILLSATQDSCTPSILSYIAQTLAKKREKGGCATTVYTWAVWLGEYWRRWALRGWQVDRMGGGYLPCFILFGCNREHPSQDSQQDRDFFLESVQSDRISGFRVQKNQLYFLPVFTNTPRNPRILENSSTNLGKSHVNKGERWLSK